MLYGAVRERSARRCLFICQIQDGVLYGRTSTIAAQRAGFDSVLNGPGCDPWPGWDMNPLTE